MADAAVYGSLDVEIPAITKLRELRTEGERTDRSLRDLGRTLDNLGSPRAVQGIRSVRTELSGLERDTRSATRTVTTEYTRMTSTLVRESDRARGAVSGLRGELRGLGREHANATVDVDGITESIAQVQALREQLRALDRERATAEVRVNRTGGGIPGGFGGGGGGAGAPPIAPGGGGGGAGAGRPGSGGGPGGFRFSDFQVPLVPGGTLGLTAILPVIPPLSGALGVLAASLASAATGFTEMGVAAGGVALAGLGSIAAVAVPAISSISAVIKAQDQLTTARQNTISVQDSQRQNAEAVRQAEFGLVSAQRQSKTAQEDLTIARRDAARAITDMMFAERAARLEQDRSRTGLARARQSLLAAELNPLSSSLDLQEAHQGVRAARLQLDESRVHSSRATEDANRSRRQGVEGSRSVRDAEFAIRSAANGLHSAQFGLATAVRNLGRGATGIATAKQALDQAFAHAPAGTRQLVADVQRLRALFGAGPSLRGVNPEIAKAQKMLTGIMDRAVNTLGSLAPLIGRTAQIALGGLGKMVNIFDRFMRSREFARDMTKLVGAFSANAPGMARAMVNIARAFLNISVAIAPFLRIGTNWLVRVTRGWADASSKTSNVQSKFRGHLRDLKAWLELLKAAGRLIHDLLAPGTRPGTSLVTDLTKQLNAWDRWARQNPDKLRSFFRTAVRDTEKIAGAIGRAVGALWNLGRALAPVARSLAGVVTTMAPLLGTPAGAILGLLGLAGGRRAFRTASSVLHGGGALTGGGGGLTAGVRRALEARGGGPMAMLRGFFGRRDGQTIERAIYVTGMGGHGSAPGSGRPSTETRPTQSRDPFRPLSPGEIPEGHRPGIRGVTDRFKAGAVRAAMEHPIATGAGIATLTAAFAAMNRPGTIQNPTNLIKTFLNGLGMNLHTRHVNFDPNADPSATAAYMLTGSSPYYQGPRTAAERRWMTTHSPGRPAAAPISPDLRPLWTRLDFTSPQAHAVNERFGSLSRAPFSALRNVPAASGQESFVSRWIKMYGSAAAAHEQYLKTMATNNAFYRGQTELTWGRHLVKIGRMSKQSYAALNLAVTDQMRGLHTNLVAVNGTIYTDTTAAWQAIGGSLTSSVEKAREGVSKGFTQMQRDAIDALTQMGWTRGQARNIVRGVAQGGQVGQAAGDVASGTAGYQALTNAQGQARDPHFHNHARGGRIQGIGLQDTVTVAPGNRAAPGELIVNRHTERRLDRVLGAFGTSMGREVANETTPHSVSFHALGGRIADLEQYNHRYPMHLTGTPGAVLPVNVVRAIAENAGFGPGRALQMAQIAHGESGYMPGIQQRDPGDGNVGYGLWQITPHAWGGGSALGRMNRLGGIRGMFNPISNAYMAKFLFDSAGHSLSPWYGTRYLNSGLNLAGVHSVWNGHHISSAGGGGGAGGAHIRALMSGMSGAPGGMQQGAFNIYAAGMNRLLRRAGGPHGGGGGGGSVGPAGGPTGTGMFDGRVVAKWIIPELQYARRHGWTGHITSGWRSPNQVVNSPVVAPQGHSEHQGTRYPHGAVDFGGPYDAAGLANKLAFERAARGYRGRRLLEAQGFRDDGHMSGTGHALGGRIPFGGWFGKGGSMRVRGPMLMGVGDGQAHGGSEDVTVRRVKPGENNTGGRGDITVKVDMGGVQIGSASPREARALAETVAEMVASKIADAIERDD